jgi:predicted nicotinamide N-methyase
VELGAGGGLVGLAVARGCEVGMPIHITDQIPMFELMKDNIALNNLGSAVVASILDWGEPIPSHIPSKPDIILAADCVYFEPAFPLLIATLHDLLGPNSVCYFCYKRRRRADLRFMKMAKKAFDVQEIRDDPNAGSYSREALYLYTIRLKPTKQPTTLTQISPPAQSARSETENEERQ